MLWQKYKRVIWFYVMGAFDDLKWTYNAAFKQLFGLGLSGELEKFMPKQGGNVAF